MDLKQNHLAHVRYTKTTNYGSGHKGEVTERVILPTYIPGDAVKALDLSHLSESEALEIQALAKGYAEYVEAKMNTVFNFEDWIAHTTGGTVPELKHRTFKLHTLEVIKSE
jgi:hypothetical protein